MDELIIALFCLIDDLLKAMNHREDPQCRMSDAEVMTTALIAAFCFGGNWTHACRWLGVPHYVPRMLSKSRFNRRLHRVKPLFLTLFACLSEVWKELNADCIYSIDTFPIPVCDNVRISRAKIYRDEAYRGLSWPNILIRSLSGQSPKGISDFEWLIVERMYYSASTP